MKILFCNYEYPPLDGGGAVNAQIAIELAKRHDVTVLTSQGFGLPKEETVDGVRIIPSFSLITLTIKCNLNLHF